MIQQSPKTGYLIKKEVSTFHFYMSCKLKRNNTFQKPNCNLKTTLKSKLKLNFFCELISDPIRPIFIFLYIRSMRSTQNSHVALLIYKWNSRAMKSRRNHQNVCRLFQLIWKSLMKKDRYLKPLEHLCLHRLTELFRETSYIPHTCKRGNTDYTNKKDVNSPGQWL